MMKIHEENNQRYALKLEVYHQRNVAVQEQKALNRRRRLHGEQVKAIHKEEMIVAKKYEYQVAKDMKDHAA